MIRSKKIAIPLLVPFLFISSASIAQLQPNEPQNVAIFLYQGVELLDFAGPGEVFNDAGFNTYTVSVDGKSLLSQGFVSVQPEYSIDNAPTPDIIIFPGGSSRASENDPRVIAWIKKRYDNGSGFMSVCTGAFIIAKAGLLDNKRVTTHYGSIQRLAAQYPTTTVLEGTRWVDNGNVITTAGVSAGIDGALHLVSRLKGIEKAQAVAQYMQYDKWDPENGVVEKQNEYLVSLLSTPVEANTINYPMGTPSTKIEAPYLGEFKNLGSELFLKGEYAQAAVVLEAGIKVYPNCSLLYSPLTEVYKKLGKPAPIGEAEFIGMIKAGKVDEALARYEKDKKSFPDWKIFSEDELNQAAYLLLGKKDIDGALKAFKLNTKEYPSSANTFDSLGEAYLAAGKKQEGIDNYKKAASMGYANSIKVLKDLGVQ